jgi:4-hydroxy-L-threonine phosphate dehydrogenase PdxA
MSRRLPLLGLMLGDMTGIGPEISARLLAAGMAAARMQPP